MGPEVLAALGGAQTVIPAALSIGGMLMQQQAMSDAEDSRNAAMNRMLERDQQYGQQAQQLVQRQAETYQPEQRQQAEQQAEDKAYGSLAGRLTAAANTMPTSQVAGKLSDDYLVDSAKRAAAETQRSADTARLMAKMRAPNDLRFGEGLSMADNAATIGSLARDRSAMGTAGQNDAQVAGQPNGAMMALGGLGQSVGTTMLGSKLMNTAKKPPVGQIDWTVDY